MSDGPDVSHDLKESALFFHRHPRPGKLEIQATKPLGNQRDLALAYSPGVAAACEAIAADPAEAATLTVRQNLVAVISNGTAVLGLGDIGPLASKPVMEGKAVLFKKFAGIDVFDIEVAEKDVDKLVDVVAALEPTFGGINLEDIKAPECFEVEERCKARMGIPVFHDDQHGTAIIVGAAVLNALELAGKRIEDVKIVTSGAGAAALACLNLLVSLGAKRENIWVTDIEGVVYEGRAEADGPLEVGLCAEDRGAHPRRRDRRRRRLPRPVRRRGAQAGYARRRWRPKPLILALANPNPEIMPDEARGGAARRDDLHRTFGLSRTRSTTSSASPTSSAARSTSAPRTINEAMKLAATRRHRGTRPRDAVRGRRPRLWRGGAAVRGDLADPEPVRPAADPAHRAGGRAGGDGIGRRDAPARGPRKPMPIRSIRFVFRSGFIMKPLFAKAKAAPKRVIYAEGEDERVLRAVQVDRRGGDRAADPDRPAERRRDAAQALRPLDRRRARFRARQSRGRPALSRLRRELLRRRRPQGHHARCRPHARAHQPDRHRRARRAARRCRRPDLRPRRPLPARTCGTSATSSAWRPARRSSRR